MEFGNSLFKFDAFDGIDLLKRALELHIINMRALKRFPDDEVEDQYPYERAVVETIEWAEARSTLWENLNNKSLELMNIEALSSFLSIYSVFEFSCTKICGNLLIVTGSKLVLRDFSDTGTRKTETILSKIGGATNCFSEPVWQRCKELNEVRNVAAHALGMLSDDNEKIKTLKKISGVEIVDFSIPGFKLLRLGLDFVHQAKNTFSEFLLQAEQEVGKKLDAHP